MPTQTADTPADPSSAPPPPPPPPRSATTCIVGAASIDAESFDALLNVIRKPAVKEKGPVKPRVGPRQTAALSLLGASLGSIRSIPLVESATTLARDVNYHAGNNDHRPRIARAPEEEEVPALFLPVPRDHAENRRDDGHCDFADLAAKGLIRDRDGEIIDLRSLWHAWGALRIDRFFQAYCRVAGQAEARGEPFPSDTVRDWVTAEAARQGMKLDFALRIIRDGCGGCPRPNAMWWRGASVATA